MNFLFSAKHVSFSSVFCAGFFNLAFLGLGDNAFIRMVRRLLLLCNESTNLISYLVTVKAGICSAVRYLCATFHGLPLESGVRNAV